MSESLHTYDESKIQTLSSLEHIRLRSGMYIGRLGNGSSPEDGIYILIKEVVDNAVDEYIMGFGQKIEIKCQEDGTVTCRDYGRGIPHGKLVECVSIINTGAKYNDDVFQFSVGLNGVGTKAVNALSKYFLIRSYRDGKYREARFEQGRLQDTKNGSAKDAVNGTYVEFRPDREIFDDFHFDEDYISRRMWIYACLNRNLRLYFNKKKFESRGGLQDLLGQELGEAPLYPVISSQSDKIEIAFTHTAAYGENHFSFVNGQFTSDGGTHLSAFRKGMLKGINEFARKNYASSDVCEGLTGAIAIKIKNPVFESQTKNKLGNTDIRTWVVNHVREVLVDHLHKNPRSARILEEKITSNERLRKELAAVKKEARAAARKISRNIPKLKDCKIHRGDREGEKSTIFITEGQSATGSMVSCRNVYYQAIYSLRGKPWNSYGKDRTAIYKNEELFNLMMALGIENNEEDLRYERIILATDADTDGYHIRNLILTFFLNYFESLVLGSHIYILETPLFRVRNKKETIYCYSENERDEAIKAIQSPEITRFKGLGEISPREFGQFIGEKIKISPVTVSSVKSIGRILEFYMGKNTPRRREYIMANLI